MLRESFPFAVFRNWLVEPELETLVVGVHVYQCFFERVGHLLSNDKSVASDLFVARPGKCFEELHILQFCSALMLVLIVRKGFQEVPRFSDTLPLSIPFIDFPLL